MYKLNVNGFGGRHEKLCLSCDILWENAVTKWANVNDSSTRYNARVEIENKPRQNVCSISDMRFLSHDKS